MSGVSEKDKFQYLQVSDTTLEQFREAARTIRRFARGEDERLMFLDQLFGSDFGQLGLEA